VLSREQVYRLVTRTPERLNMNTLAALCDILGVQAGELIEVVAEPRQVRKPAMSGGNSRSVKGLTPKPARITDPGGPAG
jgi:hypothetical protein